MEAGSADKDALKQASSNWRLLWSVYDDRLNGVVGRIAVIRTEPSLDFIPAFRCRQAGSPLAAEFVSPRRRALVMLRPERKRKAGKD